MNGTAELHGEVDADTDVVDLLRVAVSAGTFTVTMRCDDSSADLDLYTSDGERSETEACAETVTQTVFDGSLDLQVRAFSGRAHYVLSIEEAACVDTCFQTCVDFDTDPDNCGACGNVCNANQVCINGGCAFDVGEQCNPFVDRCVPGACCFGGFCTVAGGC